MVIVHLWFTGSDGVGHASLAIGNDEYVSYWPGGEGADAKKDFKLKQTHEARWVSRLSVDSRLEARPPDISVQIETLDEAAMRSAFTDLKAKAPLYNMRKHNCATVVAYLLEIGSGKPATFVPMMNIADPLPPGLLKTIVKVGTFGGQVKMWTPQTLQQYAQELIRPDKST